MKIIGVDPGLKATGFGVIKSDPDEKLQLIQAGTIEPKSKYPTEQKILTIYQGLIRIIEEYSPDILVLEKLYAHDKHPATAPKIGLVRGVVCLLAAQQELEFHEYSVKRIRKAVLGNGNANKAQTRAMVSHILKISEGRLPLDASDALALALGHANMARLAV